MTKTILFLAANPETTDRLRFDEELSALEEGLRRAKKREAYTLEERLAVSAQELQRALLDYEPDIVHFSGHGTGQEGIVLEDDAGNAAVISTEALESLFAAIKQIKVIECVVLNACFSEVQAVAIANHVKYVVGMHQSITDVAARKFAVGFYDAIGAGKSVEFAYQWGCTALQASDITEYDIPVLIVAGKTPPRPKVADATAAHRTAATSATPATSRSVAASTAKPPAEQQFVTDNIPRSPKPSTRPLIASFLGAVLTLAFAGSGEQVMIGLASGMFYVFIYQLLLFLLDTFWHRSGTNSTFRTSVWRRYLPLLLGLVMVIGGIAPSDTAGGPQASNEGLMVVGLGIVVWQLVALVLEYWWTGRSVDKG